MSALRLEIHIFLFFHSWRHRAKTGKLYAKAES